MNIPFPNDFGIRDHKPSGIPDFAGNFAKKNGMPSFGSGVSLPGNLRFLCIDSGVRVRASSDIPYVVNKFNEKPGKHLSRFSSPIPGDFQLAYIDSPSPGDPGVRDQVP